MSRPAVVGEMNPVDKGRDTFEMTWLVNTKGMKKGECRHAVPHDATSILAAADAIHPDVLAIKDVTLSGSTRSGIMGVTMYNKKEHEEFTDTDGKKKWRPMYVATASHVVHSQQDSDDSGKSGDVAKFHAVISGPVEGVTTKLDLDPTSASAHTVQKKIDPKWLDYTDKNVRPGSNIITHTESKKEVVHVAPEDQYGTRSAVHHLLQLNKDNPGFMGGRYSSSNLPNITMNLDGKDGILMRKEDFDKAVKTLRTTLKIDDPMQHGLNIIVTKLDDSPSEGDTFVRARMTRVPFDPEKGYVVEPRKARVVLPSHVTALNGGKPTANAALSAQETNRLAMGFGGKLTSYK